MRRCKARQMIILKKKQGENVFGRGSPTVASCLSKCGRPGFSCTGHIMGSSHNPSLVRLQKK